MKWMKRAILAGSLVFIFMLTGCYTVVSIPGRSVYRTETDEYIIEEEDYEDVIDEYDEDASVVVHEHYYYGDPWGMYVGFDPYWSSPYWWYYRSYGWATYYDPWYWWDPWPYGYGRYRAFPYYSGYYGGYYDPYWAYYSGYYSPEPAKRRPFERRVAYSEDGHAPPAVPLGEPRGAGVRKDTPATPATPTTTGAADTGSRPTTQRVKSSTSGSGGDRTTPQTPTRTGVSRSPTRRSSSSPSSVRTPSTRRSSSTGRTKRSSSSGRKSSIQSSGSRGSSSAGRSSGSSSSGSSGGSRSGSRSSSGGKSRSSGRRGR